MMNELSKEQVEKFLDYLDSKDEVIRKLLINVLGFATAKYDHSELTEKEKVNYKKVVGEDMYLALLHLAKGRYLKS